MRGSVNESTENGDFLKVMFTVTWHHSITSQKRPQQPTLAMREKGKKKRERREDRKNERMKEQNNERMKDQVTK